MYEEGKPSIIRRATGVIRKKIEDYREHRAAMDVNLHQSVRTKCNPVQSQDMRSLISKPEHKQTGSSWTADDESVSEYEKIFGKDAAPEKKKKKTGTDDNEEIEEEGRERVSAFEELFGPEAARTVPGPEDDDLAQSNRPMTLEEFFAPTHIHSEEAQRQHLLDEKERLRRQTQELERGMDI